MTTEAEIEDLGRRAAECELWAAQDELPYWDRSDLKRRAEAYRQEQAKLLEQCTLRVVVKREPIHWGPLQGLMWAIVWAGAIVLGVILAVLAGRML